MNLNLRKATREDLTQIIQLLANDPLGKQRESYQDPWPTKYYQAFEEIDTDKNQYLIAPLVSALQICNFGEIDKFASLTLIFFITSMHGGKLNPSLWFQRQKLYQIQRF